MNPNSRHSLNIWYLSAYDQPKGQSGRTYEYSKALASLGHKVTFFTNSFCHFTRKPTRNLKRLFLKEQIDGISIVWLNTYSYSNNTTGRAINMVDNYIKILLSSFFVSPKPDIIIGPSVPLLTGLAAYHLSLLNKCPFVFEVRDVWPAALVDIGAISKSHPIYLVFRLIEKHLYSTSSAISSVFPRLHDHVRLSGADPSKIVFLPNGVDLTPYKPYRSPPPPSKQLNVVYIGGFGLDHDLEVILHAAKQLQNAHDFRFNFNIYGHGVRKQSIELLANRLGLMNLSIHSAIPKSQIPLYQANADILIASIKATANFRFGINLNKICGYLPSRRPIVFCGNVDDNPISLSGCGVCTPAENHTQLVQALDYLYSLSSLERYKMGLAAEAYAIEHLTMKQLGLKMSRLMSSLTSSVVNHH